MNPCTHCKHSTAHALINPIQDGLFHVRWKDGGGKITPLVFSGNIDARAMKIGTDYRCDVNFTKNGEKNFFVNFLGDDVIIMTSFLVFSVQKRYNFQFRKAPQL